MTTSATSQRPDKRVSSATRQIEDQSQAHATRPEQAAGLSTSERENLDALADSYDRDDADASGVQLVIERISRFFGSPSYFGFAIAFIVVWVVANSLAARTGWQFADKPPFFWLQGIVSANALLLTIAVLIRQDRMARLAAHRAHLDLQINLLTEQKVTRILQMISDQQGLASHPVKDPQSVDLTKPADPQALLAAIKSREDDK
jgi:uncharacterized membrane protein